MSIRRPLRLPITLAISMIILIVALTVGWIVMSRFGLQEGKASALYVTLLSVGTTCLALVLVGTVIYLILTIKAINLNRRQSNFVDSVTHELKSPIASLKLYLQTLKRRQLDQSERDEFYGFMLEDIERLDELINHLLDAGRLDRDSTEQEIELVDLAELLEDCAHSVCLRHRVPVETATLDLQRSVVLGRRVDLDMVFRNLIDNAVKYAGKPPEVGITAQAKPDRLVIRIRDNGSGIPNNLRRKIFGRFVRLGSELERQTPGTGLGLYIVRTLVRRLKGRIHVETALDSDGKPAGTVFEVTLPTNIERDTTADRVLPPTAPKVIPS